MEFCTEDCKADTQILRGPKCSMKNIRNSLKIEFSGNIEHLNQTHENRTNILSHLDLYIPIPKHLSGSNWQILEGNKGNNVKE